MDRNWPSISQLDDSSGFPLLLLLSVMSWELDFGVSVQSSHPHPAILLPWLLLKHKVGWNKLHLLPPPLTIKVSHGLEKVEKEGIGLTSRTYAHS